MVDKHRNRTSIIKHYTEKKDRSIETEKTQKCWYDCRVYVQMTGTPNLSHALEEPIRIFRCESTYPASSGFSSGRKRNHCSQVSVNPLFACLSPRGKQFSRTHVHGLLASLPLRKINDYSSFTFFRQLFEHSAYIILFALICFIFVCLFFGKYNI